MKNYKVEATMKFTDKEENVKRNVGDEFETTKEGMKIYDMVPVCRSGADESILKRERRVASRAVSHMHSSWADADLSMVAAITLPLRLRVTSTITSPPLSQR